MRVGFVYQAHIGIDWEEQRVYGTIEGARFESDFHSNDAVNEVDGIMIYNLRAATTSYFSNIVVDTEIPPGANMVALLLPVTSILFFSAAFLN